MGPDDFIRDILIPVGLGKKIIGEFSVEGLQPGGALIASQDIINNLWKQFQALANINSKALHTTTTPSTQKQNFEMKPERF